MKKAVFFDRDGIVNRELGDYVMQFHDFELHEPIIPFLEEVKKHGFLTIIITNQGGIARGFYTMHLLKLATTIYNNSLALKNLHSTQFIIVLTIRNLAIASAENPKDCL